MTRVCGVFGTWQLITLVAALRQANLDAGGPEESVDDVLLVYETAGVTQEFKETLDRMARAAWPWRRIVWAYDLLTNRTKYPEREFAQTLKAVRERAEVAVDEADEIWVCLLTRSAERLLFEAFPPARIVLYEDGLISYVPVRGVGESEPSRSLRKRTAQWLRSLRGKPSPWLRFRYGGGALDALHQARLSGAYLQLTEAEPLPPALKDVPRHSVSYALLRSVLDKVAHALEPEFESALPMPAEAVENRILILGMALSRNGIMPRETERDLYRAVVGAVLARGYRVLWKEHPRVSELFFDELRDLGGKGQVQRLRLPHAYPIELVAPHLQIVGCVIGTSAAPFYLRRLYGIPCYTFSDDLLPFMRGADVFMSRMVRREAPPLSELMAVGTQQE